MTVVENFDTRYELKQVYPELYLSEVRSWVQTHPIGFRVAYPSRWVNSIYFDTHDLDTFNDHISGVPIRRKLRCRWYGENLRVVHDGQVEVKNKSELAGWKLIERPGSDFVLENNGWSGLMDEMRAACSGIARELLSVSRPVMLTVYYREYYISADQQVRLTIDSSVKGYDQFLYPRPNLVFCHPGDGQLILELKSNVSQVSKLADVLSHFPVRAGRYSKYVTNIWRNFV